MRTAIVHVDDAGISFVIRQNGAKSGVVTGRRWPPSAFRRRSLAVYWIPLNDVGALLWAARLAAVRRATFPVNWRPNPLWRGALFLTARPSVLAEGALAEGGRGDVGVPTIDVVPVAVLVVKVAEVICDAVAETETAVDAAVTRFRWKGIGGVAGDWRGVAIVDVAIVVIAVLVAETFYANFAADVCVADANIFVSGWHPGGREDSLNTLDVFDVAGSLLELRRRACWCR